MTEEKKELAKLKLLETSLIIVFLLFSIYPVFRNFEMVFFGYLILVIFISIIVIQPKITIPDNFIKNYTIGAGIISFVLYLLLDSLRDKDQIRLFPFIIYFFLGFTVFAAGIRVFKLGEDKHRRTFLGFITMLIFFGASFKNPDYYFLPFLIIALTILSVILISEIIFIHKTENPRIKIPGHYFFMVIPVAVISIFSSIFFITFIPDLVKFVDKNIISTMPGMSGYSGVSRIGDIRNIKLSRKVVMRIYGDAPFYLRGNVYEDIRVNNNFYDWQARNDYLVLEPDTDSKFKLNTGATPENLNPLNTQIYLMLSYRTKEPEIFLPENPVSLFNNEIKKIKHDRNRDVSKLAEYRRFIEYSCEYLSKPIESRLPDENHLALPDYITRAYRELALKIQGDSEEDFQKVQSISDFFKNNNFTYSLNVKIDSSHDPVLYFLTKSKAGYCEYYATASVILLRLMGVRARYVSGFIVSEEAPDKKSFIIRALHAHAWVEYYDSIEKTWKTYDPTSFARGFQPDEGYKPSPLESFFEFL
ncbi:MAG TPA: hypothetical protein ENN73_00535, partial [Firmicutes bacterium]|nr:hypothetical protein [Bacillota bacterium]